MKTTFYAIFNKRGFVRATKTKATRKGHEVGMVVEVEIPERAFEDGFLHASIKANDASFVLPEASAEIIETDPMDGAQ